jgi:N-acetylmuramoyl-L-alanine amidase
VSDQGPSSHWSSSREREERDRQRKEARERAKQERLAREAAEAAGGPPPPAGRRLTDEERRTIREFRFPTSSGSAQASGSGTTPPPTEPPGPAATSGIGTRWRDSAPPPPPPATGGTLPDLPGDNGGRRRRGGGNSRRIIFGLALFSLMAVVAFLPFGPLGDDDEPDLPTPSATLPSILDTSSGDDDDGDPEAEDTSAPGDGQAIVCIDAGHGGWDTGWERTEAGDDPYAPPIVTEADLNLGMAWMLKEELEAAGFFVVMTRPSGAAVNMFDQDIDGDGVTRLDTDNPRYGDRDELQARIDICNEAGADILISIHLNGADDRDVRGYEIFYTAEREFGQQNADLATFLYRQLDTALRETEMSGLGRDAKPDTELDVQVHDFGGEEHLVMIGPAVSNNDYQIVPSAMPGAVVETVFLSNDQDAAWIVQPENQRIVIDAYVQGILDYFDKYPA